MKRHLAGFLALLMLFSMMSFLGVQAEGTNELGGEIAVPNAGFEELSDDFITGWEPCKLEGVPYAFADDKKVHTGEHSLKLETKINNFPWARTTVEGFVPGGIYEVSAKINTMLEGVNGGAVFKLEFVDGEGKSVGEHFTGEYVGSTNNLWVNHSGVFTVPEGTVSARLYCRILANGVAWFDDVKIEYIGEPEKYAFEIGDVFHYPHEKQGTAVVNLASYYQGKPIETEGVVDFELKDGKKVIYSQKGVHYTNMQAHFTYDISLLKKKEKAYTVEATAKWNGEEEIFTQNVYVYDRPTMIGDDGLIYINGERFDPVYAYHVRDNTEGFQKAQEAGVNVIQFGLGGGENYTEAHLQSCDRVLAEMDKYGLKALFVLYDGMQPAASERNREFTKVVVDRYKDDPRVFAWAVMDEPFSIRDTAEMRLIMEESYTMIRNVDKMHPVNITDFSNEGPKYCDVYCFDNYSYEDNRSVSRYHSEALARHKGEVYNTYLAAAFTLNGVFQTEKGYRSSVYRALEEGIKSAGFFSLSDGYHTMDGANLPLYESPLWEPLKAFNNVELPIVRDILANNKYTKINEYVDKDPIEGDYWSTWTDGKVVYLIAHNKSTQKKTIEVPLTSANGMVSIGKHKIERIGGTAEIPTGTDSLKIELEDQDVVLFKLTPLNPINLDKLGESAFTDLAGYDWAEKEINALNAKNIVNAVGDKLYGPGQNITRADFAMFLIRTLGLTSDSTELFADVPADAYYAKELATGKALGILKGVDAANYNPNAEISRQDMMTICYRGLTHVGKNKTSGDEILEKFLDKAAIAVYAIEAVRDMAGMEIVKGDPSGNVNPLGNTTRAEAAVIMNRILGL